MQLMVSKGWTLPGLSGPSLDSSADLAPLGFLARGGCVWAPLITA